MHVHRISEFKDFKCLRLWYDSKLNNLIILMHQWAYNFINSAIFSRIFLRYIWLLLEWLDWWVMKKPRKVKVKQYYFRTMRLWYLWLSSWFACFASKGESLETSSLVLLGHIQNSVKLLWDKKLKALLKDYLR